MTTETGNPRSRRAILAAGAAAGVATVASALGRPSPASAVNGVFSSADAYDPAVSATHTAASGFPARGVYAESASPSGTGVHGYATAIEGETYGVFGRSESSSGYGVRGWATHSQGSNHGVWGLSSSTSGIGVWGQVHAASGATTGVYGQSSSTAGTGVRGWASAKSGGTTGVYGLADSTVGVGVRGTAIAATGATYGVAGYVVSPNGTGVSGYASNATGTTYGVYGRADSTSGTAILGYEGAASGTTHGVLGFTASPAGTAAGGWSGGHSTGVVGYSNDGSGSMLAPVAKTGVYGYAAQDANARGVTGQTTAGRGVYGIATTGTAGYFATAALGVGISLRATGRVKFDKSAGIATIAVGQKTVLVTPGIDLVSSSAVVATLMGSAGGTTNVHRVAVNSTTNTFTIVLTANNTAASPVKVAWHVFG